MIFLTVGTQFPFDRLVKAVDVAVGGDGFDGEIFGQIGERIRYKPENINWVHKLNKNLYDEYFMKASAIIGHAGIGTIAMALEYNKPLLIMPRLKKYGEVVHDHQVAIARKFERAGHLLVAYGEQDLAGKLLQLKTFIPKLRKNQSVAVANRIQSFIEQITRGKHR